MTERLYYDDAYLTEFDAAVTSCDECDGRYHVYLDRSAFYPTSGGQPYDTGDIGEDTDNLRAFIADKKAEFVSQGAEQAAMKSLMLSQ